jgi:hypothetical protein
LVLGLSPARWVTFLVSPGISYGAEPSDLRPLDRALDATRASGAAARCGFGVEVWTSERAALHPEVTILVPARDRGRRVVNTAGVGLRFGYGFPTR